jgi:hypothetical protein
MATNIGTLVFKNTDLPLLTETVLTQEGIYKDGDDISFSNILILKQVLPSLRIPPNINTLSIDKNILLDDTITPNVNYTNISNTTMSINDPNSITTTTNSNFSIVDQPIYGTRQLNIDAGSLSISDGASLTTYIDAGSATYSSTTGGQFTTMIPTYIQVNDPNLSILSQVNPNSIQMADGANTVQMELSNDVNINAEPFIRMRNNVGLDNYYYRSSINADGHNNFTFENNNSFFKQNNAFSYLTYKPNDGDFIEKNYSFVYCYNLSVIKLYNPANYLDDNGNDGWSCLISNHNGSDLDIDTAGFDWYSHAGGQQSNPIKIPKYATCRITLINSAGIGNFIWAVSSF